MVRVSNNLLGLVNIISFFMSIPILVVGIWLSHEGTADCEQFSYKAVIAIGVFLLVFSLAGIVGACCRVTWLLWLYLFVMFLLIVLLFAFTVFGFVVTNKEAGKALSGKGYKEYRLGDYSNWLQKFITDSENWKSFKSCLLESKVCQSLIDDRTDTRLEEFYRRHLTAIQSGCCKPPDNCNFQYVSPTNWKKATMTSSSHDCSAWSNDPNVLCFNCQSCQAGVLANVTSNWRKTAIVSIVFLVFLIIVYSIGCCAFRNNRRDNAWK